MFGQMDAFDPATPLSFLMLNRACGESYEVAMNYILLTLSSDPSLLRPRHKAVET